MVFRRTSHLLFVVLFSLAIGACSKDKDRGSGSESGGNGNSLELGTGTVEVSGDKTGTFTGYADFSFFDIGTTQLFDINIWSYPNQTFDLSLMSWSFPEGTTPQPGTYTKLILLIALWEIKKRFSLMDFFRFLRRVII